LERDEAVYEPDGAICSGHSDRLDTHLPARKEVQGVAILAKDAETHGQCAVDVEDGCQVPTRLLSLEEHVPFSRITN